MKALAKWLIDEYHRMIEAGILRDRAVELLARAEVRFNGSITLTDSEPKPDIAIVGLPETQYRDRHPNAADIYLMIEVAKTSLKKDTKLKATLCARAEILEYWVLNLTAQQITVFQDPQSGEYQIEKTSNSGAIAPLAFSEIEISIDQLLN